MSLSGPLWAQRVGELEIRRRDICESVMDVVAGGCGAETSWQGAIDPSVVTDLANKFTKILCPFCNLLVRFHRERRLVSSACPICPSESPFLLFSMAVQLEYSTLTTAPYPALMPRNFADAGQYSPVQANQPRTQNIFFGRIPARPPASSSEVWRAANTGKSGLRSSYLPQGDGEPGPGAYSPLVHGRGGKAAEMAEMARVQSSGHMRLRATSAAAHWPAEVPSKPRATAKEHRRRTLGDGTTMMLPCPGMCPPPPVLYQREATLMKRMPDLLACREYADNTNEIKTQERGGRINNWNAEDGPPSKLPGGIHLRFKYAPPSACWFLPCDNSKY